jgi:hypothetical protein
MAKRALNPSSKIGVTKKAASSTKFASPKSIKLNDAQTNILKCLAKLRTADIVQPKKDFLQQMSGNIKTQAGYDKNLGILKKYKLLVYPSKGLVEITEGGLEVVGKVDLSTFSTEEFHDNIKSLFSPKGQLIFDAISDGKKHNKMEVATKLNYDMNKLSGFEKNLSKMKTLGFLDKDSTTIQLTSKCFLPGHSN